MRINNQVWIFCCFIILPAGAENNSVLNYDLQLTDSLFHQSSLKTYKNKRVLFYLFDANCGFCEEVSGIVNTKNDTVADIEIVGVLCRNANEVDYFNVINSTEYHMPVFWDNLDPGLAKSLSVIQVPSVIVVDGHGTILQKKQAITPDEIKAVLNEYQNR